jgi:hypothetical protein
MMTWATVFAPQEGHASKTIFQLERIAICQLIDLFPFRPVSGEASFARLLTETVT